VQVACNRSSAPPHSRRIRAPSTIVFAQRAACSSRGPRLRRYGESSHEVCPVVARVPTRHVYGKLPRAQRCDDAQIFDLLRSSLHRQMHSIAALAIVRPRYQGSAAIAAE
jgi:hypothetical protein